MVRVIALAASLGCVAAPASGKVVNLECHLPAHGGSPASDLSVTLNEQAGSMSYAYPDGSGQKMGAVFTRDDVIGSEEGPPMESRSMHIVWRISRSTGELVESVTVSGPGWPSAPPMVIKGKCSLSKSRTHKL